MTVRLIPDLTNNEYHASEGYSSSNLKKLVELTPAKYKFDQQNSERKSNKIYDTGSAVHSRVLEPENFERDFAISPVFNLQTKAGRNFRDAFHQQNADKIIIDEIQNEQALAMAEAILKNPLASALLDGALVEQSIYFDIYETTSNQKITLKVRPDAVSLNTPDVIDIKTCSSATYEAVQKSIINFKYHLSAALYLDGVNRCVDLLEQTNCTLYQNFVFIFVENEPPYQTAIYNLDQELLNIGDALCNRAIYNLGLGLVNDWPTYPMQIRTVSAPPWSNRLPMI